MQKSITSMAPAILEGIREVVDELENLRTEDKKRKVHELVKLASVYDDCSTIVVWVRIESEEGSQVIPVFCGIDSRKVYPDIPFGFLLTQVGPTGQVSCGNRVVFFNCRTMLKENCCVGAFRRLEDASKPLPPLDPTSNG